MPSHNTYHLTWVSLTLDKGYLLTTAPTDLWSFSFSILSFCLFILFMGSQGKNTEMVCNSLFQCTTFYQISPSWPAHLEWPHMAWLSFTELDKAVVLVWLDWLHFSVIMVSVCLPSDTLSQHLLSYLGFSYLALDLDSSKSLYFKLTTSQ